LPGSTHDLTTAILVLQLVEEQRCSG
jgi:hypothetical protein